MGVGRKMNGRDAEIKDEFQSTHQVGPRSPFYPSKALLLQILWEARCGEEDEWVGRIQQERLQEDAPRMSTLPGLSFYGTPDDAKR